MTARRLSIIILIMLTSSAALANSPPDDRLQPRDLDGDTTTVEGYYDRVQNITWLRDTNLGLTETFGSPRGVISDDRSEIDANGAMLLEGLPAFISGMNQNVFLGHSDWRLPTALAGSDPGCDTQINEGASASCSMVGPQW